MSLLRRILFIVFLLFIFSRGIYAQTSGEIIRSFKTNIQIIKDGTIQVAETIVYDFGRNVKHGIFRTIPYAKKNVKGDEFVMNINKITVRDELGKSYNYTESDDGSAIMIKIGDANKTITGAHTYIITYTVSGALTYFTDHDELYWNVTGNEWVVPIQSATSVVTLPQAVNVSQMQTTCYSGAMQSTGQECTITKSANNVVFAMKRVLGANEGMTFVVGFPKGIAAVLEPEKKVYFSDTEVGKMVFVLVKIAAFFWYGILIFLIPIWWFLKGRDPQPTHTPLRVSFDPPSTSNGRALTPGEVGTLVDESADMKDISATIVSLAQKGYLVLEERKKNDFYFIQKKEATDDLLPFEKNLLKGIFTDGQEVRIKDMEAYELVTDTTKLLYNQVVTDSFFNKDPQSQRTKWKIIGLLAFFTGNFITALEAFIFGRNMVRKTQAGADAAASAQSLRTFLVSQERQLNFQGTNQMLFEKLLPYAIALGVEKQWAKRFETMNLTPPDWYQSYDSNTMMNMLWLSSFNHSMNSFASSASPPTSSSGFSSGFSGGSSGGGGGGGGGGSW